MDQIILNSESHLDPYSANLESSPGVPVLKKFQSVESDRKREGDPDPKNEEVGFQLEEDDSVPKRQQS